MSGALPVLLPPARPTMAVPSQDGLRLIFAGVAYLLAICLLQLISVSGSLGFGATALPNNAMEVRDVVALFGWVGFLISGVSVIIIPNHLRVRVRPSYLPRLHLVVANVGLVGFFASALVAPGSLASDAFLAIISLSFLAFGVGICATVLPFLRLRSSLTSELGRTERMAGRGAEP
jgi:hypothetical protein